MTTGEFENQHKLNFIYTIATALSVPSTAVWIESVYPMEVGVQAVSRRLLSSTIFVTTNVNVPVSMAEAVTQRGNGINLMFLLQQAGIDVIVVSVIVVTYHNRIVTGGGVEFQAIVIPIIIGLILFAGIVSWLHTQTQNVGLNGPFSTQFERHLQNQIKQERFIHHEEMKSRERGFHDYMRHQASDPAWRGYERLDYGHQTYHDHRGDNFHGGEHYNERVYADA
jgi:hypothetical protein